MSYCVIWEFEVAERDRAAFEAAYGPAGPWATLFARAAGFEDVELFRSLDRAGVYFTIDRWVSESAFATFRRNFAAEYEAMDRSFDGLTMKESRIAALADIRQGASA